MWSATNPGDYGASLRDSAIFKRPMSSGTAALDRWVPLSCHVYRVQLQPKPHG